MKLDLFIFFCLLLTVIFGLASWKVFSVSLIHFCLLRKFSVNLGLLFKFWCFIKTFLIIFLRIIQTKKLIDLKFEIQFQFHFILDWLPLFSNLYFLVFFTQEELPIFTNINFGLIFQLDDLQLILFQCFEFVITFCLESFLFLTYFILRFFPIFDHVHK